MRAHYLTLAAAAVLAAQEPRLSTTSRLVIAPATVVDRSGRFVDDLRDGDFELYDNGVPRRTQLDFTYFPISLVIAVQSGSAAAEMVNKTRRIGSMIEPLVIGERGEAAVITFDSEVKLLADFTSDSGKVRDALRAISFGNSGASIIDAVSEAVRMLAGRAGNRRRVLLLISEARDRSSKGKLDDALLLAGREDVAVYALTTNLHASAFTAKPGEMPAPEGGLGLNLIAVFSELRHIAKTNVAEAFARATGGDHLSFLKQRALELAVSRVGEELHSQYLLSFQAAAAEDSPDFHRIEVRVKNRPELVVRSRPGYWMPR
jgi:VWFA-related protein